MLGGWLNSNFDDASTYKEQGVSNGLKLLKFIDFKILSKVNSILNLMIWQIEKKFNKLRAMRSLKKRLLKIERK